VPEAFDRWWQRASQREPEHRFQTAKELCDALGMALGVSVPTGLGSTPMPGGMGWPAGQPPTTAGPNDSAGHPLPFGSASAGPGIAGAVAGEPLAQAARVADPQLLPYSQASGHVGQHAVGPQPSGYSGQHAVGPQPSGYSGQHAVGPQPSGYSGRYAADHSGVAAALGDGGASASVAGVSTVTAPKRSGSTGLRVTGVFVAVIVVAGIGVSLVLRAPNRSGAAASAGSVEPAQTDTPSAPLPTSTATASSESSAIAAHDAPSAQAKTTASAASDPSQEPRSGGTSRPTTVPRPRPTLPDPRPVPTPRPTSTFNPGF
jgi:serine/threonine-protein kinase